jgi:hypothetical protein
MRLFFAVCALAAAAVALPSIAEAACPGYVAAEALRDKAVDDKVHSRKLSGVRAQFAITNLKSGIASAESCLGTGSTQARAAALAVAAQLRWNQACVLAYDGVAGDKAAAVALAKASDREMDSFMSEHQSLSDDGRVLFDNWEHFDGDIESGNPESCID